MYKAKKEKRRNFPREKESARERERKKEKFQVQNFVIKQQKNKPKRKIKGIVFPEH